MAARRETAAVARAAAGITTAADIIISRESCAKRETRRRGSPCLCAIQFFYGFAVCTQRVPEARDTENYTPAAVTGPKKNYILKLGCSVVIGRQCSTRFARATARSLLKCRLTGCVYRFIPVKNLQNLIRR